MATTTRPAAPLSDRQATNTGENAVEKIQVFYEQNKKIINGVATGILIVGVALFAYFRLYMAPRETKAASKVFYAQQYFASDSLERALQGDGQHAGFIKIIRDYSGTKTANLCHYYAGMCYLRLGNTKNAIKQLEDFNGKGTMLSTAAAGALGSAYLETGNTEKAITQYKKASEDDKDIAQTPMYLYQLGAACEIAKKPEEAKKAYLRLRDEFPTSPQARDVDRILGRLGVLN